MQSRCETFMGQHLTTFDNADGRIGSAASYAVSRRAQKAIEVSGWAERAGGPPDCIAVIDANNRVIGVGIPTSVRANAMAQPSLKFGWKAVASYPERPPICAFALFPGATTWDALDNCLSEIK
jgi:hypothetical protein